MCLVIALRLCVSGYCLFSLLVTGEIPAETQLDKVQYRDSSGQLRGLLFYLPVPPHPELDCIGLYDATQLTYNERDRVVEIFFKPPAHKLSPVNFDEWQTKTRELMTGDTHGDQQKLDQFYNVYSLCEAAARPKLGDHPFGDGE